MTFVQNEYEISVLLSVYNGEKYLKEAINSILNQTFKNFEFIIIDDGSTDRTKDILQEFNDSRICLITNEKNIGLVNSLNLGLSLCKGKYIARMDADDIAYPERLEKQFDCLETNKHIGICGTWYNYFIDGEEIRHTIKYPCDDLHLRALAFLQTPFLHPTVMIRKYILEENKLKYSSEYYRAEDYGLWIELLQYTQGATIPDILLDYRLHQNNETVLADKEKEKKNSIISKIYKRNMTLNGMDVSLEECSFFAYLMDCAEYFDIISDAQMKMTEHTLKKMLQQIHSLGEIQELVKNNIIKTFTYRTIKQQNMGKILKNSFLRKIIFQGLMIYFKRYFKRKI